MAPSALRSIVFASALALNLALAVVLAFAAVHAACGGGGPRPEGVTASGPSRAPARPTPCVEVSPAQELRELLRTARTGDAFCLGAGTYEGGFSIPTGVTLWGPREAVIRSKGRGTTVKLEGVGPKLLGVTVDGSGGRFETLDAAVQLQGDDAVVDGVRVVRAAFGILVEKSNRAQVRRNHVTGDASAPLGMRGDGIRLWETRGSVVEENLLEHSRDMVVWYSSDNTVRKNRVRHGRYGTHFMYSHRNRVEENHYLANEVGVFIMYSRDVTLLRNVMADGSGAAGMGLGIKESGNITARENLFVHDTIGLYLDQAPLQQDEENLFERNVFRLGEAGVVFHSSQKRNTFRGNSLRDNFVSVRVEGGGDALGSVWEGNDFDDYAGFDLDGDGVGDVPYELRSLSTDLVSRYPDLSFFRGSAALSLMTAVGEMVPLLAAQPILRDAKPRMTALELRVPEAGSLGAGDGKEVALTAPDAN